MRLTSLSTIGMVVIALACGFISCSGVENVVTDTTIKTSPDEISKTDSTYNKELKLYILENDTTAYLQVGSNAELTDYEKEIGEKLSEYAVKMLMDYEQTENTVFSPQATTMLYSLMANFTEDNTGEFKNSYKKEMDVEHVSTDDLNSYNRKIVSLQNQSNEASEEEANFAVENKMWMKQGKTVYKSYVSTIKSYSTYVEGVDFTKSSDVSAINNAIKEVVGKDNVGIDSNILNKVESMVSSSLSFEQLWKSPFSISQITDYKFKPVDSDSVPCIMLLGNRFAHHAHCTSFDMLEIPYKNERYVMFVMLPHENTTLCQALKDLYCTGLNNVLSYIVNPTRSYHDETLEERVTDYIYNGSYYVVTDTIITDTIVDIRLPQIKYAATTELYSTAKNSLYKSDIPKVSTTGFKLNNIYQSCYLDINWKGTTARISSDIIPKIIDSGNGDPDIDILPIGQLPVGKRIYKTVTCPFYFNRPFAIFIRDNFTGTILFSACIRGVETE